MGFQRKAASHKGFEPEPSRSGGGLGCRVLPQAHPLARRQLKYQPRRMRRDALDDITQIGEGIDLQVLAGLHQRKQDGGAVRRRFAPREQPILTAQHDRSERLLRPIVLGRKNWLFAGSEAAAHRTAILFSLVQTCKHLQINPFAYLRDVIERVSTHPARLVLELTPREWMRLRKDSAAKAAA